MLNFTYFRIALLMLAASLLAQQGVAQSQMQANNYGASYSATYNTDNPALAVDKSLTTAATLSPWLVGGASLAVNFPAPAAAGQQVTIYVQVGAQGLLSASVLSKMSIRTFSSTSSQPNQAQQTLPLSDKSVRVALLPGSNDVNQITFAVTQPADQVQLHADALATAGNNATADVYAVFATVAPLPVQLLSFTGRATATGVALSWATAAEDQNDHFVVERAEGTPAAFAAVGVVQGAGSSAHCSTYQFADAAPSGLRYYRLRQVAISGEATYSSVVAVQAADIGLLAYPSPATETLTVAGPAGAHFTVLNHLGQQVQAAAIAEAQQQLDVSSLPGGVYFIHDVATGQRTRFVKAGR